MFFALLAFLLISLGCFGILMAFVRGGRNRDDDTVAARPQRPLIFGGLTSALAGILPLRKGNQERYCRFLRQAGHYHAQALTEFLALRNALVVGSVLLIVATIVVVTEPGDAAMYQLALGGGIALVLIYSLPRLGLELMAQNRTRRIEESFPDALDMVTMCTSAGLPLQHALSRVSSEMSTSHPDLAYELRIVGHQTEAGSLSAAIQQMAKRLDVPEIHSIASMIWQAEQQGASVAAAFQSFADQVRLNRRQRAEEAGNKAAFKLLFPLVLCLAPAVYLILLGPAAMDLSEFLRRERKPGGLLSRDNVAAQVAPPPGMGPALPSAGRTSSLAAPRTAAIP